MRLSILCLLLLGLLASPAAADSLVFTRDGNVHAARADGSGQVQLTQDGTSQLPYETPSQADDGTVLTVRGSRFHKLDRSGRAIGGPLGSVLTDKPGAINAFGPWDAKLSPDGSKIAYWVGIVGSWHDYGTNITYNDPQSAVVYQSAADGRPLGSTMFYEQPSWTPDSQSLLLFDELNGGVPQVVRAGVGASHNDAQGWFHDLDTFADPDGWKPIGAGELSRDGARLALLRAPVTMGNGGSARGSGNRVVIYEVAGFGAPPRPMACGFLDDGGAEIGPPTFSPDGRQVAWAAPDGIHVGTIGNPASCDGWAERLTIPGGREPDWGPADHGAASGPAAPQRPGAASVAARKRIRRALLLRRGLAVRVTCPAACRVTATLRLRKRVVGAARAKLPAAGAKTVVVRVKRTARRSVRRKAALRLAVKTEPGGTISRKVRVR